MTDGSTASSGDVAPAQSPAQVIGLPITPYSVLQVSATGLVRWNPNQPYWPPDGQTDLITTHLDVGAENGISDVTMPANALLGVFLGPSRPDRSPAPSAPDFSTPASRDYLTVAPQLKQVFFIGDGRTSANIVQRVIVPVGATRLFLGTMDGRRWYTNDGAFMVQVSPEASLAIQRGG